MEKVECASKLLLLLLIVVFGCSVLIEATGSVFEVISGRFFLDEFLGSRQVLPEALMGGYGLEVSRPAHKVVR